MPGVGRNAFFRTGFELSNEFVFAFILLPESQRFRLSSQRARRFRWWSLLHLQTTGFVCVALVSLAIPETGSTRFIAAAFMLARVALLR
jgi:hypothetical protein